MSNKFNTDYVFQPVQCSNESFKTMNAVDGYVYFVTDTKKLYIGKDGKKIPMCSSSKFFYGIKKIEYDNSGITPDPNVIFNYSEIEKDDDEFPSIPEVNDLILNIDGCFYRITGIADDGLETKRLTLQGTGTGGPGGDGESDTPAAGSFSFILKDGRNPNKIYSSMADTMPLSFTGQYNGTNTNNINYIEFRFSDNQSEEPFFRVDGPFEFNIEQTIDLKDCQSAFNASAPTKIYMYVYDLYGASRSTFLYVQLVNFMLSSTNDNIIISRENNNKNTIIYNYNWTGITTEGLRDKELIFALYEENNLFNEIKTFSQKNLSSEEGSYELDISDLNNNVYVLKVKGSAMINANSLPTNELIHKVVCYKTGANPLLAIYIPENTEQYTNIPIEYNLTAAAGINKKYAMKFSISGDEIANINIQTNNDTQTYNLYFDNSGKYTFNASIDSLGISFITDMEIKEYSSSIPVIENRADLKLHLNPRNKSNNDIDRDLWIDKKNNQTAQLSNFYYGNTNGWLIDEEGVNYLSLTSGAKLEVPNFRPFKDNYNITSIGLTIELDFEINGVLDYNSELISCVSKGSSKDTINTGFIITGNSAKFYKSTTDKTPLLSFDLVEDHRTKISFVIESNQLNKYPMVYGYVNGKMSGARFYDKQASFEDTDQQQAIIKIDSSSAQIKIYGIRVYEVALSDKLILNNYIASMNSNEEKTREYQDNNVYTNNIIDFNKVTSNSYNIQIPYMILTGGYPTGLNDDKWCRQTAANNEAGLPVGKKDYRMVDVEVRYPNNDIFKDYKNYKFINEFANGKTMANAFGQYAINGGAIMYAQGTSSMEYPIKNLRLRFKNEDSWYSVRPDISPVEIICMKADYMESSGSHNTGAANLIDDLYKGINIQTPGQKHFGENIVTCIKGYPCLIFYSPSGDKNSYEYIGKYNLNLDKATPEPFGFMHDNNFGWLESGDKYYAIDYDDEGEKFIGQENPSGGGDYVDTKDGEESKVVQTGEKINSIHCFEFLDNAVEVCNFKNKAKEYTDDPDNPGNKIPNPTGGYYTYNETWYGTFENKDGEEVPGWTLGFESRYPEDRIGYHDADMLYPLASWLNGLDALRQIDSAQANARFKNEYQCYLNKDFTLAYYIITEALLMADSRVKNMMIATWGKENPQSYYPLIKQETLKYIYAGTADSIDWDVEETYYQLIENEYKEYIKPDDFSSEEEKKVKLYVQTLIYSWIPDETQDKIETNFYKFYPIFYDMDTMLGLDNTGVYRFNYYDEDTNSSIYNGDEVLWTFVRDTLQDELGTMYQKLESKGFTANKILTYFNDAQANVANEAFYNGDAKYKYINPAINGYWDYLNNEFIGEGKGPYLYAAQGDRTLSRQWFLNNRIKFLNGKYNSSNFKTTDCIEYRWYYPNQTNLDDKFIGHESTLEAVPPTSLFEFTSARTGYAGVMVGANASGTHIERFNNVETKTINASEGKSANGTEAYLLGVSNLSDLGDLSNKYMQKFVIKSSELHLRHLTLGNANKGYYNPYWADTSSSIDLSNATYLEEFNLQNCLTYTKSLDFTSCLGIRRILLTHSGVDGLLLPVGGAIEELRLPTTVRTLVINSHPNLRKDNFSIGEYTYGSDNLIGGNGIYENNYTLLQDIRIVNTPIDTYKIIMGTSNDSFQKYYLPEVDWTIDTDDKNMINNGVIDRIPILDYLLTKKPVDIDGKVSNSANALTGKIEINIEGASVNEFNIYNKYITKYPNLSIIYGDAVLNNSNTKKAKRIYIYPNVNYSETINLDNQYKEEYLLNPDNAQLGTNFVNTLPTPILASTTNNTYIFTGKWVDFDTKIEYWQDGYEPENAEEPLLSSLNPQSDNDSQIHLIPIFDDQTRYYTVSYYNSKGEKITAIGDVQYTYNSLLKDSADHNTFLEPQLYYQYLECNEEHYRYDLEGWISQADYENKVENPTIYNIDEFRVVSDDLKLYAYFKKVSCLDTASPIFLFTIEGNTVSLNDNYKTLVQGKITLPGGYTSVGNYQYSNLTHVYIPSGYTAVVGDYGFTASSNLKYVKLPDSIKDIGHRTFNNCDALVMTSLPKYIETVGTQAFLDSDLVDITDFSRNIYPNLTMIEYCAFYGTGKNSTATTIAIPDNVKLGHHSAAEENKKYGTFAGGGYSKVNSIVLTLDNQNEQIYNNLSEFTNDVMGDWPRQNTTNITYEEVIN